MDSLVFKFKKAREFPGFELVEPDLPGGSAFLEEQDDRFHPGPLERAAGAVEDDVEVAVLKQFLAQGHRGVVGVREERVLDDDGGAGSGPEVADEVLEEQEGGLAGLDREILLDLPAFNLLANSQSRCNGEVRSSFAKPNSEALPERMRKPVRGNESLFLTGQVFTTYR